MLINNLRNYMIENKITVNHLRRISNVSHKNIDILCSCNVEEMKMKQIEKICNALDCGIECLIKHIPFEFKMLGIDLENWNIKIKATYKEFSEDIEVDYNMNNKLCSNRIYNLKCSKEFRKILTDNRPYSYMALGNYIEDKHYEYSRKILNKNKVYEVGVIANDNKQH